MFENLREELRRLAASPQVSVPIESDAEGYLDKSAQPKHASSSSRFTVTIGRASSVLTMSIAHLAGTVLRQDPGTQQHKLRRLSGMRLERWSMA